MLSGHEVRIPPAITDPVDEAAPGMPGRRTARTRLRSVALPTEHGGWGFLLEPIVLGLLVAPSLAGVALALAGLGVFLLQHPLKLVVRDRLQGKTYPRTRLAQRVAAWYGGLAVIGLLGALFSGRSALLLPILIAAPLGLVQLGYALANQKRALLPEVLGALALGTIAPAIALASPAVPAAMGGMVATPEGLATLLWLILAGRSVPSIFYVRARLRLIKGEPAPRWPAVAAHGLALAMCGALALSGALVGPAPAILLFVFAVLLVRAVHGLYMARRALRAQRLGFQEVAYGLLTAILPGLAL